MTFGITLQSWDQSVPAVGEAPFVRGGAHQHFLSAWRRPKRCLTIVCGLKQVPIILLIENFRAGLVWKMLGKLHRSCVVAGMRAAGCMVAGYTRRRGTHPMEG